MTTVYSFTRVEPVSRGGDPGRGLAATVQDPFWMLARQRQFGELTGEDAGSPVQVAFVQTEARFDGWKPESGDGAAVFAGGRTWSRRWSRAKRRGPRTARSIGCEAGRALAAAVSTVRGRQAARGLSAAGRRPTAPRLLVRAAAHFADGLAVAAAVAGAADGTDAAARRRAEASDRRRESRPRRPRPRSRAGAASPSAPDRTAGFPSGSSGASSSPSAAPPCWARPATRARGSTGTTSTSSPKRIR